MALISLMQRPSSLQNPSAARPRTRWTDWRLHLGVHKTATTHMQEVMDLARAELRKNEIDVVTHKTIAANRIPELRRRSIRAQIGGSLLRRDLLKKLAPHLTGQPRVVLSHEDWIGTTREALEPMLYPKARFRLGALLSAVPRGIQVRLYISIRSFDTFLPSTYATALKYRAWPFRFDDIRERLVDRPPSWVELIERIRSLAPGAELIVWPYELYRPYAREIISLVTGYPFTQLPEIADPLQTRTPTEEAIRAAERLPSDQPHQQRLVETQRIYEASFSRPGTKFRPFSDQESRLLREAYQEQLTRLASTPGVHLIDEEALKSVQDPNTSSPGTAGRREDAGAPGPD